jgi:alpha-1,2-mannosyltransferase
MPRRAAGGTSILTRYGKAAGAVVCAVFLIVNLVNAIRKGGDFDAYFDAGWRLLVDEPLYEGSAIASGFVGPPAQALLFAPFVMFAPLGPRAAHVAWYVVNVILLWYALSTWISVMRRGRLSSRWAILSILAVAVPLQVQFEHQNLNIVLLALVACAVASFRRGRAVAGGIAIGVAAAVKVYPVCLLAWLAIRGQWRAVGAGTAALYVLTLAPVLFRGVDGLEADTADWRALAGSGWPTRRANQSLIAMWGRYLLGEGPAGYPTLTLERPLPLAFLAAGLTAAVVVGPLLLSSWRHRASRRRLIEECACVNALAVLLSPIAWEHYWVAFFPVFLALGMRARGLGLPACVFWLGLLGLTLLSRPIVGWHGARVVRAWSLMTWIGLLLCATLAYLLAQRRRDDGTCTGSGFEKLIPP